LLAAEETKKLLAEKLLWQSKKLLAEKPPWQCFLCSDEVPHVNGLIMPRHKSVILTRVCTKFFPVCLECVYCNSEVNMDTALNSFVFFIRMLYF
jgi:hypothetical protein